MLASVINVPKNKHEEELVLLKSSASDDALCYYASVHALSSSREFLVYLAESSLLLDRVRLKRKLLIQAYFSDASFNAELSLAFVPAAPSAHAALVLTLLDSCEALSNNEKYCPLT